jgi:hypothetical protein
MLVTPRQVPLQLAGALGKRSACWRKSTQVCIRQFGWSTFLKGQLSVMLDQLLPLGLRRLTKHLSLSRRLIAVRKGMSQLRTWACSSRILRSPSCESHAWAIESGSPGIHRCRVGGFALALMLPEPRNRPLEPFVKVGRRGTGEQRAEPIALSL